MSLVNPVREWNCINENGIIIIMNGFMCGGNRNAGFAGFAGPYFKLFFSQI
jgi:hypothetical protein